MQLLYLVRTSLIGYRDIESLYFVHCLLYESWPVVALSLSLTS